LQWASVPLTPAATLDLYDIDSFEYVNWGRIPSEANRFRSIPYPGYLFVIDVALVWLMSQLFLNVTRGIITVDTTRFRPADPIIYVDPTALLTMKKNFASLSFQELIDTNLTAPVLCSAAQCNNKPSLLLLVTMPTVSQLLASTGLYYTPDLNSNTGDVLDVVFSDRGFMSDDDPLVPLSSAIRFPIDVVSVNDLPTVYVPRAVMRYPKGAVCNVTYCPAKHLFRLPPMLVPNEEQLYNLRNFTDSFIRFDDVDAAEAGDSNNVTVTLRIEDGDDSDGAALTFVSECCAAFFQRDEESRCDSHVARVSRRGEEVLRADSERRSG
jgi:hypothetical protein